MKGSITSGGSFGGGGGSVTDEVLYFPRGGGQDDAPFINGVNSGSRRMRMLSASAYTILAVGGIVPANGTVIEGSRGGTVTANIPGTGFFDCPITGVTPDSANGNSGTLAADTAIGDLTVSVNLTLAPTVGQWLEISHGVSDQIVPVLAFTGSGPYTVTVSRVDSVTSIQTGEPVEWVFKSGDPILEVKTPCADVVINGNGMIINATAARMGFEIDKARRWSIRDLIFNCQDVTVGGGFDIGGQDNLIENLRVRMQPAAQVGLYMQSNLRSRMSRNVVFGAEVGIALLDCADCWVESSNVLNAAIGFSLNSLNGDVLGNSLGGRGSGISKSTAYNCPVGFVVWGQNGATLEDCSALDSSTIGYESVIGSQWPNAVNIRYLNCTAVNCATSVYIPAGIKGSYFRNFTMLGYGLFGFHTYDDVTIDGLYASSPNATAGCMVVEAGQVSLKNANIAQTTGGGAACLVVLGGALTCFDVTINSPATYAFSAAASGSSISLVNCIVTGASSVGVLTVAGSLVRIGKGCNLNGCAFAIDASCPIGTVVMDQSGGTLSVSATHVLNFTEHYNTGIELLSSAAGAVTVTTFALPGMTWDVVNDSAFTLTLQTTVAGTVTVAAGKCARVRVNAVGVMKKVSADN